MDKAKTGNIIKEARIRKGYTQQELGEIVGVTNKAVSRWENAESYPDIAILDTLAAALDISVEEIINGVESAPPDTEKSGSVFKEMFRTLIKSKLITRKTVIVSALVLVALSCVLIRYRKYRTDIPAGIVRNYSIADPSDFEIQKMQKEVELKEYLLNYDKNIIYTSIHLEDSEGKIDSANIVIVTKHELTDLPQQKEILSHISEELNIATDKIYMYYQDDDSVTTHPKISTANTNTEN